MDLSDLEIAQLVGQSAFKNGAAYHRQGRVGPISRDGATISAVVKGSGRNRYVASVKTGTGDAGRAKKIFGHCSCPVGANCKHVAALLLEARATTAAERDGGSDPGADRKGGKAVVPAPPPLAAPELPPHIASWIEALGAQEVGDDYPPDIAQRLIYLLGAHRFGEETPTLSLAVKSVRLLKSGAFSSSVSDYDPSTFLRKAPPRYLRRSDLAILRAIALAELSSYRRIRLEDAPDGSILADILKTGRARWNDVNGPALSAGPARAGRFIWEAAANGAMAPRLTLEDSADAVLLAAAPPVYVAVAEGLIGPVATGLSDKAALAMMRAPALAPAQMAAVAGLMRARGGALAELAPPAPSETVVLRDKPKPALELFAAEIFRDPGGFLGAGSWQGWRELATIGAARASFGYGPASIEPDSPETTLNWIDGTRLLEIRRDRKAEKAALRRLGDFGLARASRQNSASSKLVGAYHFPDEEDWFPFLYDEAPVLAAEGWDIRIAEDFPYRLLRGDGDVEAGVRESSGLDWFELDLGVTVDGEKFDLVPALLALIGGNDPDTLAEALADPENVLHLRQADGRYLSLPGARLRPYVETLIQLMAGARRDDGRLRFSALDAAHLAPLEHLAGTVWSGGDRLRALGRKLAEFGQIPDAAPPDIFLASLRPYQARGFAWLDFLRDAGLGGILADDMGLGKTLQALALIAAEKAAGRLTPPALVIAPTSLMTNWRREAEKFAPDLRVLVLQGLDRKDRFDEIDGADIVLSTYPLIARDKDILSGREWSLVILDEAQAIKNPNAATTRLIYELKSRGRFCLTGTPIENNLAELWSLFHFIAPGFLGDFKSFTRDWRTPIEKKGSESRSRMLAARVKPFLLRRTKEQVALDLPERTEMIEAVAFGPAQQAIYDTIRLAMHERVRAALAEKGLARSRIVLLDALLKLRQTCCDPRLLKHVKGAEKAGSAKLERLMEMVEELVAEGRKLLIFSQFTSMLDVIRPRLDAIGVAYALLTGDTKDRAEAIAAFQNGPTPVFLISLKAGGVGLNLTAADTVILYDPWWNPAAEAQAIGRAHRIGREKPVFVYKLTAVGTIEEKIEALKARKATLAESLFDPDSAGTLDITEADIDALFGAQD